MRRLLLASALFAAAAAAHADTVTRHYGQGTGSARDDCTPDVQTPAAAASAAQRCWERTPDGESFTIKWQGVKRAAPPAPAPVPAPPPPPPAPPPAPTDLPQPVVNGCPPGGSAGGTWRATGLSCPLPRFEGSARRVIEGGTYPGIEAGGFSSTASNITFRRVTLRGPSPTTFGLWARGAHQNIVFEDGEITGFVIGVHLQGNGSSGFVLRNSRVHRNSGMGLLGASAGGQIVGNTFEANNFSGSNFNHAIYLGSGGVETAGMRVVGNTFTGNSVVNGVCTGGQLTVHGQFRDLLIAENSISVPAATGACYGISVTPAYASAEWFRGLVVRGNTVRNTGGHAIAVASAPGARIEGNRAFNAGSIGQGIPPGPGDDDDRQDQTKVFAGNCGASIVIPGQQSGNTATCAP